MATRWLATADRVASIADDVGEYAEADGLLDYLHTLYRVAHAAGASHWCTPGHNRGRVCVDHDRPVLSLVPLAPVRLEEMP